MAPVTQPIIAPIKCLQLNLQHSRAATVNLTKLIVDRETEILLLQEPYVIKNNITGISKRYRIFSSGEGRNRSVIVTTNNRIDAILIKQLSNLDTVVLEACIVTLKRCSTITCKK